ncbi:hypothetical protein [Paenibacillus sp. MMO-177]|uniref:hypothetical protein n=1 Tax=Paenibacillus sp. MMO-177 TaxID=3081289 RepID=UPI0030179B1F
MSTTTNLALYYPNTATDGANSFNTDTMLRDNWVKLDNKFSGTTGHSHDGTAGNGPKIGTAGLAAKAVTAAQLADNTITAAQIALKTVTAAQLADNTVGSGQLAAGAAIDAVVGNRSIDDTVEAATGADTISNMFSKLGNMVKKITGKSNWYTAPAISLETVNGRLNQAVNTTSSPSFVRATFTQATGTAPLTVASTTVVTNLNADLLDGQHGSYYAPTASPTFSGTVNVTGTNARLQIDSYNGGLRFSALSAGTTGSTYVHGPAGSGDDIFTITKNSTTLQDYTVQVGGTQSGKMKAGQFISTVADGTAPMTTVSSTVVPNLNVDMVDGYHLDQDVRTTASPTWVSGTATGGGFNASKSSGDRGYSIGNMVLGAFSGWDANTLYLNTYSASGARTAAFSNGVEMYGNFKANGNIAISNGAPIIDLYESDQAGADEKRWWIVADGKSLQIRTATDAGASGNTALTISRGTGLAVGGLSINATMSAPRFQSTQATGTSPFVVSSTTVVTNLNADLLDGQHGSYYAPIASPSFTGDVSVAGKLGAKVTTAKGYVSQATAGVYQNQYTKIATLTTNQQYSDYAAKISVLGIGTGAATVPRCELFIRVKLQAALGNNPFVELFVSEAAHANNFKGDVFSAVVATLNPLVVDLYVKNTSSYNNICLEPYHEQAQNFTCTWLENQPYVATLPIGEGSTFTSSYVEYLYTKNTTVDDGAGNSSFRTLTSTVATGTAPFTVASTTAVANLNVDMLDGKHANDFALSASKVSEYLLSTTAATTIATYTPPAQGNYLIGVYMRVVTGATNVTVTVNYADASGAQTTTLLNNQSTAVGSNSLLPVFINAVSGTAITVKVTAGTASRVYASASIVGV